MFNDNYVIESLELHLFFGRIMKEHSLFLKAGFTSADANFAEMAEFYKQEFEKLLSCAVSLSNGIVGCDVVNSGELITEFTRPAEKQTQCFTGIAIDREITERESELKCRANQCSVGREKFRQVKALNRTALRLLDGLIAFKETVLRKVLRCDMFTMNYPLLIEHIIREAKLYRDYVCMLEKNGELPCEAMRDIECFWNRIMMEHALFIRGLLDPCETELFNSADGFAKDYSALLEKCRRAHDRTMTAASLRQTVKFRDFKAAGTKGIENCEIRSVILPLLADHVLREANHYIRLLQC